MADLVRTIPQTDATVPPPVRQSGNGTLPASWLRSFDGTTATAYKMFAPVSYAMQALIIAALKAGFRLTTTGRYRSYERQEALFLERFLPGPFNPNVHRTSPSTVRRVWAGREWFLRRGVAMAATPGASNHGWGIADDICEAPATPSGPLISLRDPALAWLRDNAHRHGFALDTWEERWHWHWYRPGHVCELTHETVDVLAAAGVTVPDLSTFGFTAPTPPPTPQPPDEEDDMARPKVYLAYCINAKGVKELWRGNGIDANRIDAATQKGIEGRKDFAADGRMRDKYVNPNTGEILTHIDQVPTLDSQSHVIADLGRPRG